MTLFDLVNSVEFHGTGAEPEHGSVFQFSSTDEFMAISFTHDDGSRSTYMHGGGIFDFDADGNLLECSVDSAESEYADTIMDQLVDGSLEPLTITSDVSDDLVIPGDAACHVANSALTSGERRLADEDDDERMHPRISSAEDYEHLMDDFEEDEDVNVDEAGRRRLSTIRSSKYYAQASSGAYREDSTIIKSGNAAAKVMDGGCTIAFRGSNDLRDWLQNANGWSKHYAGFSIRAGFVDHYKQIHSKVQQEARKCNGLVVFTGHSLGGATAEVARRKLGGYVVTFGAPKLFKNRNHCYWGKRYFHENDMVAGKVGGLNWDHHQTPGYELYSQCKQYGWSWRRGRYCKKSKNRSRYVGCFGESGWWGLDHSIDNVYAKMV